LASRARVPLLRLHTRGLEVLVYVFCVVFRPPSLPRGVSEGGRVRCCSADRVKPGRPWCPGGRVLRVLRVLSSDRFPIIPSTAPKHRNNKSGNGKARGAKGDRNMQCKKRSECLSMCIMRLHRAVREHRRRGPWRPAGRRLRRLSAGATGVRDPPRSCC
jgi:hypothetical protein